MDPILARKLNQDDDEFQKELVKLVKEYVTQARNARDYWIGEWDIAHDIIMCYAALSKEDFDKLEKGHPRRFILPTTSTQITTMTTFISQMLFGQDTPNKVEPRGPKDETPAEFMNQLLIWNSEQQPTYLQGYLWIQDCLAYNRGVFYNSWAPIFKTTVEMSQVPDPDNIDEATGQPKTFERPRRVKKAVGGYCKRELVSPYDVLVDPALPLCRLQEMRFVGHKTLLPWTELANRSKLDPSDPAYVLPSKVAKLKDKSNGTIGGGLNVGAPVGDNSTLVSRTQYERQKAASPAGSFKANKEDAGIIECYELWVKLCPNDHEIYGKDADGGDEPSLFQILMADDMILSINESTYAHGMFPYSIAEGRPNGMYQYSPSWVMLLKGIQDYVDWLKDRHQDALSRTVGNVFVVDPEAVDVNDFLNPQKEGKIITLKPEAAGKKISEVFQQVPIKDLTENFQAEVKQFISLSETVSGANSNLQGQMQQGDNSATEYAGTAQMAAGRLASLARLLSVQGLVTQTRQFVENFQQFMTTEQEVRFKGGRLDLPPELQGISSITINHDTIQGDYNFIAHDGTLPGTDAKKVAAITRLLEGAAAFPDLFQPAPGNLDIRKLFFAGAKASGLNVENFVYTQDQLAQLAGPPPGAAPGLPQVQPPGPALQAPGPSPATPTLPALDSLSLPSLGPTQPRPQSV